jgi:cytochrome c peroxidase
VTCWPQPEVPNNIDMTTGALGLTDTEENQVVAFLQTLTDGFTTPYKNADTFTGSVAGGQCKIGGDPRTQGNETIIPTWSLTQFPCATDICGVAPLPGPTPVP